MEEISIIAACAKNRAIGGNGKIPWKIPEETAHFKATTMGGAVIFGRKTFEGIGKPLPGRFNVVISRRKNFDSLNSAEKTENAEKINGFCKNQPSSRAGAKTVAQIKTADSLENAVALCRNAGFSRIFICGGAQVYREALEKKICGRLIISEINEKFSGSAEKADAFFPEIKKSEWKCEKKEIHEKFTVFSFAHIETIH